MTEQNRQANLLMALQMGAESWRAAQACAGIALWNDAVSRAYYSAFHHATALLFSIGVQARSHRGTHDLLYSHFVQPGLMPKSLSKIFIEMQRDRETADYGGPRFDEAKARKVLADAQALQKFVLAHLEKEGWRTK